MKQDLQKVLFYPLKKINSVVMAFAIVVSSPLDDESAEHVSSIVFEGNKKTILNPV